jgi:5-methylcytosine-specific restriction endonuclease McrA
MSGDPFPKSRQLARGARRYRRLVASPAQWQRIIRAKGGPCRVCWGRGDVQYHHLVTRQDHGDDVPDNIVPVCRDCHAALHNRAPAIARLLLTRLTDAEYAYMIDRGGEDYPERAYGISYER